MGDCRRQGIDEGAPTRREHDHIAVAAEEKADIHQLGKLVELSVQGADQRAEVLGADEGSWGCTFVSECTEVCPKNVDPAGAIQRAKVSGMLGMYKSLLPWGKR